VTGLHENPHITGPLDTVINYVLLKDSSQEENVQYLSSLLEFCRRHRVGHLIHVSSISVYRASVRQVSERAASETDPSRKGAYGALKVATDNLLLAQRPADLRLSLVRPGFILGEGLVDPIVGMAFRAPWNRLLLLGNSANRVPVTTRDLVSESLLRVLQSPPAEDVEVLLLADNDSPTRREYLEACCRVAGCGTSVLRFPPALWRMAAVCGAGVSAALRLGIPVYRKISGTCRAQSFDSSATQARLGMDLSVDWRRGLHESLGDQQANVSPPYEKISLRPIQAGRVTYWGFGRVVRDLHLPALRKLRFRGRIEAFDLRPSRGPDGLEVRSIHEAEPADSDLLVVCSPGPAHVQAIEPLARTQGPILIEKPLCYSAGELQRWLEFARRREAGVFVCHNYRFKVNVARMIEHLKRFNPGRLLHAHLNFQSPPVRNDGAAWLRDERSARTLLMDYAIHFLDLACMFATDEWRVESARHLLDHHGQTSCVDGRLASPQYSVSFLLRQGFMPRRARLTLTFRNYMVRLGFFPETFTPHMSHDDASLYGMEKRVLARATRRKIFDKLRGRSRDDSHAAAYLAATGEDASLSQAISVERLRSFYDVLFDLCGRVYSNPEGSR